MMLNWYFFRTSPIKKGRDEIQDVAVPRTEACAALIDDVVDAVIIGAVIITFSSALLP